MDNGPQMTSKFLLEVFRTIGMKVKFTTTYRPQTNGQAERFNRTILSALRRYTSDHPRDWDMYTDALTYSYNTQVHSSTNHAPLELILSRPPPHLALEEESPRIGSLKDHREGWLVRLKTQMDRFQQVLRS